MNPALFKHRITFMHPYVTKDNLKQEIVEYINFKSVYCMIKTTKGTEYFAAGAEQATNNIRFVIRYTKGITTKMRINYKGRIFDIIEPPINDDEANKTLTIIAKERV